MTSVSEVDWQMAPEEISSLAQRQGVGEVAVVGDGEAAGVDIGKQRLHIASAPGRRWWSSGCGRGRCWPLRRRDDVGIVEVVADEAEAAFGMEVVAVVGARCRRPPGRDAGGRAGRARSSRRHRDAQKCRRPRIPRAVCHRRIAYSRDYRVRRRHRFRRSRAPWLPPAQASVLPSPIGPDRTRSPIGDALPAQLLPTGPVCHVTLI